MGCFLSGSLRRDSVQGRLFEGLRDLIDAAEDIRAMAGPFIRPFGEVTNRIANVLNSALFGAFFQQPGKLFE